MDGEIISGPLAKKRNVLIGGSLNGSDMSENRKGPSFVHCNICSMDFSVASGGLYDIKCHIDGKKHSEAARRMTSQSKPWQSVAERMS